MDAWNSTTSRGGRGMKLVAVALSLLATGCTMCPDPFDYAGPVPNGSVSQNDFAARSNGILPVRATPLPWPPIVQAAPRMPTPAEDPVEGPALLAAAPEDLIDDESTVVEASLTEAVTDIVDPGELGELGELTEERSADGAREAVGGSTSRGDRSPARAQWQAYLRRRLPGPQEEIADASPTAAIRESRLPKDSPTILLR